MRNKLIFSALISILLVATGWWLWTDIWNNGGKIREKKSELKKLETKYNQLLEINESFPMILERYHNELAKLDSLKSEIPNRDSFVKVFEEIRRIAKRQNIIIKSLSPNLEDSYPAIKHKLKLTKKYIERYPVQIHIQGEFLTIGIFLEEILSLPTILNIGRISLGTELDTEGVLACELVLYAYIFFDEEST
ncbi:MAG: type 4a pilus biogenesis protein PilO [Candidatus Marinimicrobia bacterium]|nr:type 4a pilus biogenesis protein PilO [Candidatus Neomarinimicrobiota bacterium]